MKLDHVDIRILNQLQDNSDLSNQELAQRVHISAPTCLRRVKRLKEAGVIRKQVALLDASKIGYGLTVIVELSLDRQGAEHIQAFEQQAQAELAIQQCYHVATGPDFILILQLADMQAYHALAHRLFTASHNVRNVRSFFASQPSKFETRYGVPDERFNTR